MSEKRQGNYPLPFTLYLHSILAPILPIDIISTKLHTNKQFHNVVNSRQISTRGYCKRCKKEHIISVGQAQIYSHYLMDLLTKENRLDLTCRKGESTSRFSTDYLFGKARGQMFGVLVFQNEDGRKGAIPAFSGQYNGHWEIEGWAPPILDPAEFQQITCDVDRQIKTIGRQMTKTRKNSSDWCQLQRARKVLSQNLMQDIHGLYKITNFRGEKKSLQQIFHGKGGIPSGTGDCCAPKLLNFAAKNRLTPLGLAEFYWGKENPSKTRQHGEFYHSCQAKCAPILGFMLCGLTTGKGLKGKCR